MRWAVLFCVLLAACAPDEGATENRAFDISRLTASHQRDFFIAVDDLNARHPSAGLSVKESSSSLAEYSTIIDQGASGKAIGPQSDGSWVIQFDPWFIGRTDYVFLRVATHELCHVIGFGHGTGNPQGDHC